MSGHHFHVHGPHDHAVEHAAHGDSHGDDNFASRIAVMTALLSTIGALFGYMGGATQNDAMLHKNSAAIKKTEASNQWNYYQAKSNKQNLAELAVALNSGADKEHYAQEAARYKAEKEEIRLKAEALEEEVKEFDHHSEEAMHLHHRWAQAMTAVQVAISLAAITLLTRKRWLFWGAWGASGIGAALALAALMHF
ncbi:MAG: DUF4337 domain-containing protein [Rhodocyclaceae bacterium]|nr:MAG: DUF4337 domain-containing protein [Rhodocyclaceae bacterium]